MMHLLSLLEKEQRLASLPLHLGLAQAARSISEAGYQSYLMLELLAMGGRARPLILLIVKVEE